MVEIAVVAADNVQPDVAFPKPEGSLLGHPGPGAQEKHGEAFLFGEGRQLPDPVRIGDAGGQPAAQQACGQLNAGTVTDHQIGAVQVVVQPRIPTRQIEGMHVYVQERCPTLGPYGIRDVTVQLRHGQRVHADAQHRNAFRPDTRHGRSSRWEKGRERCLSVPGPCKTPVSGLTAAASGRGPRRAQLSRRR